MAIRIGTFNRLPLFWLALLLVTAPAWAKVRGTAHDLTVRSHPGDRSEVNPCDFCHTPHNSNPSRALWNRDLPATNYRLYDSSTLQADLNQPTGSSRLCLSCHDGTVAMGDLRVSPRGMRAPVGHLKGKRSLGLDLSDEHPISFVYDKALALSRKGLVDPSLLGRVVKLDLSGELQCTSCHNPHEDRYPDFLVMDNRYSRLCLVCHRMEGWEASAHAVATTHWTGADPRPWGDSDFNTVAENGCSNCHDVHSARRPEWLLNFADEAENCLVCHRGQAASKDVEREFKKFSAHPVEQSSWIHEPAENPLSMQRHVTCSDCHNPHSTRISDGDNTAASSPRGVRGTSASGAVASEAGFEYEMCFNCHGVAEQPRGIVVRQDDVTNTRLEFEPQNRSHHAVVAPGRNPNVSGLEAGYTTSSQLLCSDCHNSDSSAGVRGPHGSRYAPILERNYQLEDPSPETFQSYELCYKCHSRTALLNDTSGFSHRLHVVEEQASCAVCHDAHGSRGSPYLINFMTGGKVGNTVVSPSSSGRLEFRDLGPSAGECHLTCHESNHNPRQYPGPMRPEALFRKFP